MKEVGECIVPARAPKDAMQQYGEVLANDMIAFSYTVIIYRGHSDVTKKRKDLEVLATLEKVSTGSTLYFYRCRDPKDGHVLVATKLHRTEREKNRKKYPLPPDEDNTTLASSPAHSKPSSRDEENDEDDFFIS